MTNTNVDTYTAVCIADIVDITGLVRAWLHRPGQRDIVDYQVKLDLPYERIQGVTHYESVVITLRIGFVEVSGMLTIRACREATVDLVTMELEGMARKAREKMAKGRPKVLPLS